MGTLQLICCAFRALRVWGTDWGDTPQHPRLVEVGRDLWRSSSPAGLWGADQEWHTHRAGVPVRPACRQGAQGSEALGRPAGAAPAAPHVGPGGRLRPHPHGTVPPTGPPPARLRQEIAQTQVDSESCCSCFGLMLPTVNSWSLSCLES